MFRANVGVIERLGFLGGEGQYLFHPRRVRDIADHLLVRAGADLFLDLHPYGLEVKSHFLENIDCDALAQFDQSEQEVFGADKIVIEPVGLLARQRQHLLGSRREIIHGFVAHSFRRSTCFGRPVLSSAQPCHRSAVSSR